MILINNQTVVKGLWIPCVVLSLLACTTSAPADVIYSEDFTGQLDKGVRGPNGGEGESGPQIDFSGVDWTVTGDATVLSNQFDRVLVRNQSLSDPPDTDLVELAEGIEARDLKGELFTWVSPVIDIAGFIDLTLGIDLGAGLDRFESDDVFDVAVKFDGGAETTVISGAADGGSSWTMTDSNGSTVIGNTLTTFSDPLGATGSTLEILVKVLNTSGTERQGFDNISVTGVIPEPSSFLLLAISGALLAQYRRRHS